MQTPQGAERAYRYRQATPVVRWLPPSLISRTGGRPAPALAEEALELPNHAWRTAADDRFNRATRDAGWLGGHGSKTEVQSIESQKEASIGALQNGSRTALYKLHKRNNPGANLDWIFSQPVWESW